MILKKQLNHRDTETQRKNSSLKYCIPKPVG